MDTFILIYRETKRKTKGGKEMRENNTWGYKNPKPKLNQVNLAFKIFKVKNGSNLGRKRNILTMYFIHIQNETKFRYSNKIN